MGNQSAVRRENPMNHVTGIYEVRGEDPNPCMGGAHHTPLLGYFEGRGDDILNYAETLPGWKSYGGGGSITLIKIKQIDENSVADRAVNLERRAELVRQLEILDDELGDR